MIPPSRCGVRLETALGWEAYSIVCRMGLSCGFCEKFMKVADGKTKAHQRSPRQGMRRWSLVRTGSQDGKEGEVSDARGSLTPRTRSTWLCARFPIPTGLIPKCG